MTAQSTPESPTSEQMDRDPGDVLHPLSAFVRGTLTIHFDGGSVVTSEMAQLDARAFLSKQRDVEVSDEVSWESRGWFSWASERVVYPSFDAARDQNWPITPESRRRLDDAGHPDGVIQSLVRLWERQGRKEPMYSIRAVVALHHFALDGVDSDTWEASAISLEGERGARLVGRARAEASRTVRIDLSDDDQDVDDAPAAESQADCEASADRAPAASMDVDTTNRGEDEPGTASEERSSGEASDDGPE